MRQLTPFGLEIRKKLLEKNMTIADLTRELEIPRQSAIGDMIYGVRPCFKYRKRVAEYLGIDVQSEMEAASNE